MERSRMLATELVDKGRQNGMGDEELVKVADEIKQRAGAKGKCAECAGAETRGLHASMRQQSRQGGQGGGTYVPPDQRDYSTGGVQGGQPGLGGAVPMDPIEVASGASGVIGETSVVSDKASNLWGMAVCRIRVHVDPNIDSEVGKLMLTLQVQNDPLSQGVSDVPLHDFVSAASGEPWGYSPKDRPVVTSGKTLTARLETPDGWTLDNQNAGDVYIWVHGASQCG